MKSEEAIEEIRKTLEDKASKWSRDVKIKDGYVCTGCGELDKELLESHHTKPKDMFPELAYDLDNGECKCLLCHANKHKGDLMLYYKILARLGLILYNRIRPKQNIYETAAMARDVR